MEAFKCLVCLGLLVLPHVVLGQVGRARCLPTTTIEHEFRFEFRFARQTDTLITQLAFYNSSIGTPTVDSPTISDPAQCVDNTLDANDLFIIGFSVDGDAALPCGIIRAGDTYTITMAVGGNTPTAYRFQCITAGIDANLNKFPSQLTITNFETGPLVHKVAFRGNAESLRFQVTHAFGNKVPALSAEPGQMLHFRAIFDKDNSNGKILTWFPDPPFFVSVEYSGTGDQAMSNTIWVILLSITGPDNFGRVFNVAFLPHDNAELSLIVVTPGLGTWVKVTGSLPGSTFTKYYPIKRDEENKIIIPSSYKPASTASTSIDPLKIGIKVEVVSVGEVVAIRAESKEQAGWLPRVGSFMVLPDDVLGTKYNCYTGSDGQPNGQILAQAVQDATILTVKFNGFAIAGFTLNNTQVTPAQDVNMNANDVVNIQCGTTCHMITLQADKPFGVVTGHEDAKINTGDLFQDHFVSQLPPVSTYGTSFVLFNYTYQIILENPAGTVDYTRPSGVVPGASSGTFVNDVNAAGELFVFDDPVLLLQTPTGGSPAGPFTAPWPSTYQWATRHYLYVYPGTTYTLTVVAQTGEIANIEFRDESDATDIGSKKLGMLAEFSATSVAANTGPAYEQYTFSPTVTGGPALVELKSGAHNKPFMLSVFSSVSGSKTASFMAIGTRFPTVNPCVNSAGAVNSFSSNSRQNIPGDMIDNNCDGSVDEQINDGTNDGSDLAPHPVNPHIGIYVSTLIASSSAMFPTDGSAVTKNLITGGCSANTAGALAISPFTWNRDIGAQFTTYHVMDTKPFGAFSLGTLRKVYFRATIGFCHGNLTGSKCDNSCQTGRKRRDDHVDETVILQTELTLTEGANENQTGQEETCTMNKLYWIPAVILLVTLIVEAIMIGVFVFLRASMKSIE